MRWRKWASCINNHLQYQFALYIVQPWLILYHVHECNRNYLSTELLFPMNVEFCSLWYYTPNYKSLPTATLSTSSISFSIWYYKKLDTRLNSHTNKNGGSIDISSKKLIQIEISCSNYLITKKPEGFSLVLWT